MKSAPSQPIVQNTPSGNLVPTPGVQLNPNPMGGWQGMQAALRQQPTAAPQVKPAQAVAYAPQLPAPSSPGASVVPETSSVTMPVQNPTITKAEVASKPKAESGAKFDQFLKILTGVSNLANTAAAVKTAFTSPKTASGSILRGGGAGGLSAAPGVNLQPLGALKPGDINIPQYQKPDISAGGSNNKDLLSLLKALG